MKTHNRIIAAPLQTGDTVGIIAPAGKIAEIERFQEGIKILKEMGFNVKFPRELWPGDGYLSATDIERGKEFNQLWRDPEVKALLSLRGGFGCLRMLGEVDLKTVKNNPKYFIGFSDITILHTFLTSQADIITLHGPVLTSLVDCTKDALERFHLCLRGKWNHGIAGHGMEILRGKKNKVYGSLTGGNLSSLVTLLGTPFDQSWTGKIVVLEDINEPLYRIDRMLTQLSYAGRLTEASAILIGDFSHQTLIDPIDKLRHHECIWKRILELTHKEQTAVWANFPSGHFSNNMTLPMGAETELDHCTAHVRFQNP